MTGDQPVSHTSVSLIDQNPGAKPDVPEPIYLISRHTRINWLPGNKKNNNQRFIIPGVVHVIATITSS
jgi:hypothetical protein